MGTRTLPADIATRLGNEEVRPFYAVEMEFDSDQVNLWTGNGTIVIDGKTYIGTGLAMEISDVEETAQIEAKGLTITLSGIASSILSLAITEPYQGRACRVYYGMHVAQRGRDTFDGSWDTLGTGWSADSNGDLTGTPGSITRAVSEDALTNGSIYEIDFTVALTSERLVLRAGDIVGTAFASITESGSYSFTTTAYGADLTIQKTSAFDGTVSDISIRQLVTYDGAAVTAPRVMVEVFSGYMDTMDIQESGDTCTIQLAVENRLIELERPRIRRLTNEDQQSRFPGDLGLEFVEAIQEREIYWGREGS
jgi:hypothetical protein